MTDTTIPDLPLPSADDAPEELPVETALAVLESVVPALGRTLADLRTSPVAIATPEERKASVDLYWLLKALQAPIADRLRSIELAWMRGMTELGATTLPLPDGRMVGYEPPRSEWRVRADALKRALAELEADGLITENDLDKAFTTTVTVTADNRVLNHLAQTRGAEVAQVINEHRSRPEPSPLAGRVRMPQPRKETP